MASEEGGGSQEAVAVAVERSPSSGAVEARDLEIRRNREIVECQSSESSRARKDKDVKNTLLDEQEASAWHACACSPQDTTYAAWLRSSDLGRLVMLPTFGIFSVSVSARVAEFARRQCRFWG